MNQLILLSQNTIQALGWTLLHALWQGLIVALLFAFLKGCIKDARLRYAIACSALVVMIALPAATFMSLYPETSSHLAPAPNQHNSPLLTTETTTQAIDQEASITPPATAMHMSTRWNHWSFSLQSYLPEIVACWMMGVLVLSLRLMGGCWFSYRLKYTGTIPLPQNWQQRANSLTKKLHIRQKVNIVTSSIATIPMVVGIFRPVVLIPISTLLGLTQAQLEVILIHELAHIRRYDNLVNLLQRCVETVFFFHPAVWWISHCIRIEREHCCDDVAVHNRDPKLYASALTALDDLRSPILATAATDGPLLSRIRRLLATEQSKQRDGLANATASHLITISIVILLAVFIVESTQAQEENRTAEKEQAMNIRVDVKPAMPHMGTTLASSVSPLMRTLGRPEWSMARLQGLMGHAFQFEMKEGGGSVYHDNLDWGIAMGYLPKLAKFRTFSTTKAKAVTIDLPALKKEARDAVLESLDRGVPALVWQPISPEMRANGHKAFCWGLIVGYNKTEETYTIRHPFVADAYTIRYDAIGHADPKEWFNINVYEKPMEIDEQDMHRQALQNAIAFAKGVRYTDKNFVQPNGRQSNPYGFAAYEVWRKAFESENIPTRRAHHDAEMLQLRRQAAATYLRELVTIFPKAAKQLEIAARHYEREMDALVPLYNLFHEMPKKEKFSNEERAKARQLIGEALETERKAIAQIEVVLNTLDAQ